MLVIAARYVSGKMQVCTLGPHAHVVVADALWRGKLHELLVRCEVVASKATDSR